MSSSSQRLIRRQFLRNAEGYLELATLMGDQFRLPRSMRINLGQQALNCLTESQPGLQTDSIVAAFDFESSAEPESDPSEKAETCFLLGMSYELTEQLEPAIEWFSKSIHLDPLNMQAYSFLACCYRQQQQWDLAIGTLIRGLRLFPDNAVFYYNAACYCGLADRLDEALQYLLHAFRLNPALSKQAEADQDFQQLHDDRRFKSIVYQSMQRAQQS